MVVMPRSEVNRVTLSRFNRAVIELLAKALGVPKTRVKILSGVTSRLKQVVVDGDPKTLGDGLRVLTTAKVQKD